MQGDNWATLGWFGWKLETNENTDILQCTTNTVSKYLNHLCLAFVDIEPRVQTAAQDA